MRGDWSRGVVHQGGVIVYRGEPRGVEPRGGIPRAIPGVELEQSVKSRLQRGAQGWSPGVEPRGGAPLCKGSKIQHDRELLLIVIRTRLTNITIGFTNENL